MGASHNSSQQLGAGCSARKPLPLAIKEKNMIKKGRITTWNDDKGFGFITPSNGGKEIFVHIKAFKNHGRRPEANRLVTYTEAIDKQGRICAAEVTMSAAAIVENVKPSNGDWSILLGGFFIIFVIICGVFGRIQLWVLGLYIAMSLITYFAYAIDKNAAQNGERRTPEDTLHLLSLFCGWPGAIFAQQKLRHKSKKESFRTGFWFTVTTNVIGFFLLTTPSSFNAIKATILNMK